MKRLDLDDLPPKIAALLSSVETGEELVLVQAGAVVARLTGAEPAAAAQAEPDVEPEQHVKEVFDHFRSAIEEEF
jgi:antitoxin (DNA-binding transcriptional repressor) of toxin-antitoxin stability system